MPVADGELRLGLQEVLRRPVRSVVRRAHPYGSSHTIEDVDVTFDEGPPLALVFKDVWAPEAHAAAAKPASMRDPDREIEAYREVLEPGGLDVPACYGALSAPGRRWLFLEAVDGIPLWQTGASVTWQAAARWLAGLHAQPVPTRSAHLLAYDAVHLHGWLRRALTLTPPGALDEVAAVWARVVQRLVEWPQSVVHGDFHPSNILVQGAAGSPRIRPVDWELAGVGPGLLDLAALTSGSWSAAARQQVVLAYRGALPPAWRPDPADLLDALAHCRLFVAVQWLGWSADWSPPTEHAHDWLAEASALARELTP
ncbi:MAG: phosphotransferase [Actinomycetota bacterium]|nr:phosphotransferase [Actinomycetota bacterium]